MTNQDKVDQFNKDHNLRSFIKYKNEKGEIIESEVRHEAELIEPPQKLAPLYESNGKPLMEELPEPGIPVVWVKGNYNAVNLNDIVK